MAIELLTADIRSAPCHPRTQGRIKRRHQTLKNRILLENYVLPGDPEARIQAFVEHDNHQRCHESLNNVTPSSPPCAVSGRRMTAGIEAAPAAYADALDQHLSRRRQAPETSPAG